MSAQQATWSASCRDRTQVLRYMYPTLHETTDTSPSESETSRRSPKTWSPRRDQARGMSRLARWRSLVVEDDAGRWKRIGTAWAACVALLGPGGLVIKATVTPLNRPEDLPKR